jgi:hypothetical protein
MVAVAIFCEVCSKNPADFHIRFNDGHDLHFCSGECMNHFTENSPDDETTAFYLTTQVAGAIPNGSDVVKVNSEPGDCHPDGTPGVVVGSAGPVYMEKFGREMLAYFVQWDGNVAVPIGTIDIKVKKKT